MPQSSLDDQSIFSSKIYFLKTYPQLFQHALTKLISLIKYRQRNFLEIPHVSIPLYDRTHQTVSHDTYYNEYGEYRCYSNAC